VITRARFVQRAGAGALGTGSSFGPMQRDSSHTAPRITSSGSRHRQIEDADDDLTLAYIASGDPGSE
jgi:hypothetical protein